MKVSIIIPSGSTEQNAHVRINCLWRCMNSLHNNPGIPFEIILIDNAQTENHHQAIQKIFRTYPSVTHLIVNRVNEMMGGAFKQGCEIADGKFFVFMADDCLLSPGWLSALLLPLERFPDSLYVGALEVGPNVRSKLEGKIYVDDISYTIRTRAGCYVWALRAEHYNHVIPWQRKHFADTRMANRLRGKGFSFIFPTKKGYLAYSNLNYLRPWEYQRDKANSVMDFKKEHMGRSWEGDKVRLLQAPEEPKERYPLRNKRKKK